MAVVSDFRGLGTGDGWSRSTCRRFQPGAPLLGLPGASGGQTVTGPTRSIRIVGIVASLALILAACGGSADKVATFVEEVEQAATTQPSAGATQPSAGGATGSQAQAELPSTLKLGEAYTLQMPEGTPTVLFTFDVPVGGVVMLEATAAEQNTGLLGIAIGPAGERGQLVEVAPGATSDPFQYVTSDEGSGPWVLEVGARSGDLVTLLVDAPLQEDGGVVGDAGANAGVAKLVDLGGRLDGLLGRADFEDWYTIPLEGGDVVSIILDAPIVEDFGSGGVSADLVYNGATVTSLSVNAGGEESVVQIFAQDQTGEAYLRVNGYGAYGFTIDVEPQRDGGMDGDAGGDLGSARPVELGTIDGIIGGEDLEDFFVLALPVDAVVSVEIVAAPDLFGSARVELLHNGEVLVYTNLGPGQTESWTYALVNSLDASLYLRVASAAGTYSASIAAVTQPDGGDGAGDASDEESLAKEVMPEGSFDGILNGARQFDNRDWYQFTAVETATLNIELAVDPAVGDSIRMLIYDDAKQLMADIAVGQGGANTASIDVIAGTTYTMQLGTGGQAMYTVTFG